MIFNRSYTHKDVLTRASISIQIIDDTALYKGQLFSSNGNIFSQRDKSTDLYVRVYKGLEDITTKFTDIVWKRFSTDTEGDKTWGDKHAGKTDIVVTKDDINDKANIQVEVYSLIDNERTMVAADFMSFIDVNDMQGSPTPPDSPKDGDMWLDTSVTPPRLMVWDSNLGMWVEVMVAGKDRRNLIRHSNFFKKNFDNWTAVNSPILEIESKNAKRWARIKSDKSNTDYCGISQTVSASSKEQYSFQMLSEVYIQSAHPNGDATVAFYSINKMRAKTLIKEETYDVLTTAKVFTSTFATLADTHKIEVVISGKKTAPFDFLVTNIKLEKYPTPTEWELAIEDIQDALDSKVGASAEEVFDSLTDGGKMQGIYVDTDELGNKNYYVSGRYLDAKNLVVRRVDDNIKTLEVTERGEISIRATSLSIGSAPVASQDDVSNAVKKTVKNVDVMYRLSDSETSLTGNYTWSTTAPQWINGKFMWSKTVTTFADNTTKESSPTCLSGAKGQTGASGTPGKGVTSITEEYYLSTSKTTQTGGSWTTTPPTWSPGKYIWTRSKIVYSNPTSTAYTTPVCDSSWEAVNEIEIGVRNLLKDSKIDLTTSEYRMVNLNLGDIKPKQDEICTITLKGELGAGKTAFGIYNSGGTLALTQLNSTNKVQDGLYQSTFKWKIISGDYTAENTYISIYAMTSSVTAESTIEWVKLERGNKVSLDWEPAQEDIDESINDANITADNALTAAEGKLDNNQVEVFNALTNGGKEQGIYLQNGKLYLNATYMNLGQMDAGRINTRTLNIINDSNIVTFGVNSNGDVKIHGTIESTDFDNESLYYGYKLTPEGDAIFRNATISGEFITPEGGISNYGAKNTGENMLKRTAPMDTSRISAHVGTDSTSTVTIVEDIKSLSGKAIRIKKTNTTGTPSGGRYYTLDSKLEVGTKEDPKEYSWSVYVKGTGTISRIGCEQGGQLTNIALTEKYQKITHTFTATESTNYQFVFYATGNFDLYFHSLKLERGNISTPWTPALDDNYSAVRFWAGATHEERHKAPFQVLSDGSVIATKGQFSGLFSGEINIGNIFISDTTSSKGAIEIKDNTNKNVLIRLNEDESYFVNDLNIGTNFISFDSSSKILENRGKLNLVSTDYSTYMNNGSYILDTRNNTHSSRHVQRYSESAYVFEAIGSRSREEDFVFYRANDTVQVDVYGNLYIRDKITMNNKISIVARKESGNSGFDFVV